MIILILFCVAMATSVALHVDVDDKATVYFSKWFILYSFMAFTICWQVIKKRFGSAAAMLVFYVVVNCAWFWLWKDNRYLPVDAYNQMAIRYFGADAIAKFILCLFFIVSVAYTFARNELEYYGSIFCVVFAYASSFSFWIEVGKEILSNPIPCAARNSCGGILGNPSVSATVIMIILPVILKMVDLKALPYVLVFILPQVIVSKSSIAIGMAVVMLFLYSSNMLLRISSVVVPMLAGYWVYGSELLNTSDRVRMWTFFMDKWSGIGKGELLWHNIFTGTGFGNFGVFSVNLQVAGDLNTRSWWFFMHSDILQFTFEVGLIGLVLLGVVYFRALKGLYGRCYHMFVSLVLAGVACAINFPAHTPFGALIITWLLALGLLHSNDKERRNTCTLFIQKHLK